MAGISIGHGGIPQAKLLLGNVLRAAVKKRIKASGHDVDLEEVLKELTNVFVHELIIRAHNIETDKDLASMQYLVAFTMKIPYKEYDEAVEDNLYTAKVLEELDGMGL